jgi:hypothetical protein
LNEGARRLREDKREARKHTLDGLIDETLAFGNRLETAQYAAPITLRNQRTTA